MATFDLSNEVQRWLKDTSDMFLELASQSGPGDGDFNVNNLVAAMRKVSQGYAYLYDEGHIANVLKGDAEWRCNELQKYIEGEKGDKEAYAGTVTLMAERELASKGIDQMRAASGVREMLWTLRVFRFMARLFTLLQTPGASVGTAARHTYSEVLGPYHSWLQTVVVRLALSLAPSRDHLMAKAGLTGHEEQAIALMKHLVDSVTPVVTRLGRYYTDKGIDFQDVV